MNYAAAIDRFSSVAREYCQWLEADPGTADKEHRSATCLVAELYAAALTLPSTEPTDIDPPALGSNQRAALLKRLNLFPFQYYWEIFHPLTDAPEEAVCGDVTDDLRDIYVDVKEGLLAYAQSEQAAVWHWRTTFGFHWGEHATSALRALHAFELKSEASR